MINCCHSFLWLSLAYGVNNLMSKTTNKNLLAVVLFLFLLGILYFFIATNTVHTDNVEIHAEEDQTTISVNNLNGSELMQADESNNIDPQPIEKTYQAKQFHLYKGSCGYNSEGFEHSSRNFKSMHLSENQLIAVDGMYSKCKEWYDFFNKLNEEETSQFRSEYISSFKLNKYFDQPFSKNHEERKQAARSVMDAGFDTTEFSSKALKYLLKVDIDFRHELMKALNISEIKYIEDNVNNIVSIYDCQSNFNEKCASGSYNMLVLCVYGEEHCGRSYEQIIASTTTPNNYADILQIVEIIRNLVNQGYFDGQVSIIDN